MSFLFCWKARVCVRTAALRGSGACMLFAACVPSCALHSCLAIESVLSEVNFFVSSKRNFNILVHMEELKNNAFRRSLKISPLKTVSSYPFEPSKYDVRWNTVHFDNEIDVAVSGAWKA